MLVVCEYQYQIILKFPKPTFNHFSMVHDSIRYFIRLLNDNEGGRDCVAAHRVQEDEREALPEVAAPQKWLFPFQDVSLRGSARLGV